jgi:hypothetical protein
LSQQQNARCRTVETSTQDQGVRGDPLQVVGDVEGTSARMAVSMSTKSSGSLQVSSAQRSHQRPDGEGTQVTGSENQEPVDEPDINAR